MLTYFLNSFAKFDNTIEICSEFKKVKNVVHLYGQLFDEFYNTLLVFLSKTSCDLIISPEAGPRQGIVEAAHLSVSVKSFQDAHDRNEEYDTEEDLWVVW